MKRQDDISKLVEALGRGSAKAFDALYAKFHNKVENLARALLEGHTGGMSAKDIAQAVFIKVWEKRTLIAASVKDFDSYLFTMTRNETLNYLSRSALRYTSMAEDLPIPAKDNVMSAIEASETERQIDLALDNMPPQRKRAFLLSRIQGLAYKDIAKEMDISSKTVEKHISSALKDLKKTLS